LRIESSPEKDERKEFDDFFDEKLGGNFIRRELLRNQNQTNDEGDVQGEVNQERLLKTVAEDFFEGDLWGIHGGSKFLNRILWVCVM
jgi:hypothetical protein